MKLFILLISIATSLSLGAKTFRTLTNSDGKEIQAELISKKKNRITFRIKGNFKSYTIPINTLSKEDQTFIKKWKPEIAEDTSDLKLNSKIYPRTKQEINSTVQEILNNQKNTDDEAIKESEAVRVLNVYRYLCGVKPNVKMSKKMNKEAEQAAIACKKHGSLSHSLGSFTNKSNLSTGGDVVKSVTDYMNDAGANNRERRGHRYWCLNPAMGKTGFGSAGARFSAMWSLDQSGSSSRPDAWAYPGQGFYPKEYMHGNGWSLYLSEKAPNKSKLTITMHKLSSRPDKLFGWNDEIPGKQIKIDYISTHNNSIIFEPSEVDPKKTGIYYITVKGGGVKERYVVELY